MGDPLGIAVPLAVGAAISPTTLAIQLLTLSRKTAPLGRAWAIAAGYVVVLAIEMVIAFGLAASTGGSGTPSKTEAGVKLAFAFALAWLGIRALHAPPKPPKPEPETSDPKLGRYFVVGLLLMAVNVTSAVLYLPAMHDVGTADIDTLGKAGVAALVLAIAAIPAVAPPLAVTLLGERAQRALARLNDFAARHHQAINAGICFAFAAFLAAVSLPVLL